MRSQKEIENQRQKGFPPSKPQVLWLFLLLLCLLRAHKLNLKLKCSVKCKANKDELGIGWRSWSWPRKWVRTGLILAFMIELIWIFNKPTSACISPYFVSVFDQLRQKDFWHLPSDSTGAQPEPFPRLSDFVDSLWKVFSRRMCLV